MTDATDKLARTRLAILEYAHRRKHGSDYAGHRAEANGEAQGDTREEMAHEAEQKAHHAYNEARRRGASWVAGTKRALGVWWRHHPAHMGVELATPVLSAYAARRPVTYLTAAAAVGALVVVTRPWRLVSATGLLVALLKSGQISSMVMSAISAANVGNDPYA